VTPRRHAPRPVGDALGGLTARWRPASTLAAVQSAWAGTVGDPIANEAEPVSERDGVLTVSCRSAVWAQELDLMGPELVERLNKEVAGGPLKAIRAVADKRSVRPSAPGP
jgi:predicted nucleic acid-binding Zn ribbon protein